MREYLVQQGIPAGSIRAEGRGSTGPLVDCEGSSGNALVTCLAPNRRVEISGIGG
ncbi:Outer membrane protein A precursor [compost metagenome]